MNHKLDCVEGGWPAPDSERNLNFEEAINASCKKSLGERFGDQKIYELEFPYDDDEDLKSQLRDAVKMAYYTLGF